MAREICHVVQASRPPDGVGGPASNGANGSGPYSNGSNASNGANGSGPYSNGSNGSNRSGYAPELDQAEAIRACYKKLLDLLRVSVSVDVLTGTSAGGINAACLGVAEGYQSTLADLRDVWLETGSFSKLLRDPQESPPVSVLQGDNVMLSQLNQALTQIRRTSCTPTRACTRTQSPRTGSPTAASCSTSRWPRRCCCGT